MSKILKICLVASLAFICLSANAAWQCTVVNPVKNQTWIGVGPTRAAAMENAMKFCSNNSINVKNCNVQGCFQK